MMKTKQLNRKRILLLLAVFGLGLLLVLIVFDNSLAFRPMPPPGTPKINIKEGEIDLLEIQLFSVNAKVSESFADVQGEIELKYLGDSNMEYLLEFFFTGGYFRGGDTGFSSKIEINKSKYEFEGRSCTIDYTFEPEETMQINYVYRVNLDYVFSGPPSPWIKGECFEVDAWLFYSKSMPIFLKIPKYSEIYVEVPNYFENKLSWLGEPARWEVIRKDKTYICKGKWEEKSPSARFTWEGTRFF